MNKAEILAMSEGARRMPAREASYRNLVLNQRIEANSPFITKNVWLACNAEPQSLQGCRVFGGLDLSSVGDLTCLVLAGQDFDGMWNVVPFFWLPSEGLAERSRGDREPYDLWARKGLIELTPGSTVSYEYVAGRLREIMTEYNVMKVSFDPWHMAQLSEWLVKAGFSQQMIKEKFFDCGQGFRTMSPALRVLEELMLEKKLRHGGHPVLNMCAANAVVETDAAGNRKLSKKKASGKIDGLVALAMALAAAPNQAPQIDIEALIG
jgi:phage terminase large subunit-like protein